MSHSRSETQNTQTILTETEHELIILIRGLGLDGQKIDALGKVARGMAEVGYGEVIIKVQGGKVVWVDRYERERVG